MKFKYLFVPILAVIACGSLQAQTADTNPSATPGQEEQHNGWGRGGGWGRHRHGAWVWRKLNLSDSQKTQIKSIREQVRPALAGVLKARLQLRQDIEANSDITNDKMVLANAEAQLATVRNNMWNQIKTVLNPDQLTTLNNFKQKQEARMQEMINKLSQPAS